RPHRRGGRECHPRRRGGAVDRDGAHARRHRHPRVPAPRRRGGGGVVAGDRGERAAHVGVVPHAGRAARAALGAPRHPLPPLFRDRLECRVSTIIHSARLVDGQVIDDAWVCFDDGQVARSGTGETWIGLIADEIVDAGGAYLAPGFIDLHGHGGAGVSYDDGPDAVLRARDLHRAHGTT